MVEFKEFLKNPSPKVKVPLYTEIEVIQTTTNSGDNAVRTSRLDRIEESIAKLTNKIDNLSNDLRNEMNTGFKQVNTRIDNLEARIDQIDARLDYIVKANNLKDSK